MLYDGESCRFSKSYHLHIVDRVGGGTDAQMPEFTQSVSKPTPTKATPEKEFEPYKGKIRKSGTGCVTMINDHLYEGRFTPRVNGKRISKNVYAKTREECEEKLAELIKTMNAEIAEMKRQLMPKRKRG